MEFKLCNESVIFAKVLNTQHNPCVAWIVSLA